ncbi:MAG: Spy/CpxP family protein refolding chaperone [Alphaproteobacteria bacterium]|uniref:Spy/CpxP family protein refolding chaperone n=1 Tax=Candidatus Nitrobium versatile TaxID=2884831 RepID=A0A953JED7_9BACT|nr:Spy/CpxP family protein refolding chaperone [Candidatus Nitrobium versatile]
MKRQILIGALLSIAIAGGAYSAQAETACCRKADVKSEAFQEHCIKGKKRAHKRHFKHMAKVLGLSDLQKEKVKTILKSGRQANAPLRQQLAESRKALRQATHTVPFDEAAVRAIAEKQTRLRTELIVAESRMWNEVYALLTPEQKDKAGKLFMERRKGHKMQYRGQD